jgi:hypothetical protein
VYNASVEALQPPQHPAAAAAAAGALQEATSSSSSSSSSRWTVELAGGAKVSAERVIFSTGERRHIGCSNGGRDML